MNTHDIIIFAINIGTGLLIGLLIGFATTSLFTHRKIRRAEKETWTQASTYYRLRHKQDLP